jgi:hypothetical protein
MLRQIFVSLRAEVKYGTKDIKQLLQHRIAYAVFKLNTRTLTSERTGVLIQLLK